LNCVTAKRVLIGCWLASLSTAFTTRLPARAQNTEVARATSVDSPQPLEQGSEFPPRQRLDKSMRVDVNMVLVPVSVTDVMNRPVMDLRREDFALFQDDELQKVEYFSTEDAPISVGLLLDLSKSMTNKFDMERAAVTEFFKNANKQDDYFTITFSDRPKLITTATQSIDTIQSNLALQTPDGNTALFDAISEGADRMRLAQLRRKALLIISDGGDNHSRHHLREIRRSVQDSDIEVYAIGIFDSGPFKTLEEALGKKWLSQITDSTGGRTIAVDSRDKIPEAAAAISREIRSRYVLGYRPNGGRSSARRKIRVQVASHVVNAVLHAYYKTGYVSSEGPAAHPADKN
jgi:Ca-activated chloride channel homolog